MRSPRLPLLLSALLLAVLIPFSPPSIAHISESAPSHSEDESRSYDADARGSDDYYATAAGLSGSDLHVQLYSIIRNHSASNYPQTYDDLRLTDESPSDSAEVTLFYTRRSHSESDTVGDGNVNESEDSWNREHLWPKSHGGLDPDTKGAGTDLHALRPADKSVNEARGHLDFDNADTPHSECTGCYYSDDAWEPPDEVKGDTARAMFYMDVRYNGDGIEPQLILSFDYTITHTTGIGYLGRLCTLYQWHFDDPVDSAELARNEVVYSIQNNRNPFIDRPDFVPGIWGPGCDYEHVVISEFLVSPSSQAYNGTDWNGDGSISKESDQFIELYNPTPYEANISGWWLNDDPDGGSPRCQIGWGTLLQPGERMVFYRATTGIELDYWDGDVIRLEDSWGNLVDSASFPGEHSYYDVSYGRDSTGSWVHIGSPTPGSPNDGTYVGPNHLQGSCYVVRDHIHEGQYILKGRVVTMNSEDAVLDRGNVFVKDGVIQAVWADGEVPGADVWSVPEIDTGGTIYPGLLDAHNHIHYNTVPLWDMGDNVYNNRYQWKNHSGYKPEVTWPKTLLSSGSYWNMEIEALKHAEMKAIVGGTTSVQGNPTSDDSAYTWVLARNMEHNNFGRDQMHTKVTELESDYIGNHIKTGSAAGTLDAWFLHLSEGTDASSLAEFQILVDNDLLVPELNLVHGVPLGANEYQQMGAVGASLIWSPTSNLLLYGETADVAAAKAAGVNILLAPDWSPSGTKSPLHELKMADWLDENRLGNIFTDYEQVEMVTTNVVDGIGWTDDVGRIQTGLAADLVVIDSFHSDPYRNLIEALDPDVALTIVGGLPIYGDVDLMTQLNGDDKEVITWNGMTKALDVTFMGVDDGEQTWADIEAGLEMALQFNKADMHANFGAAGDMDLAEFTIWADDKWPQLDAIGLDSIFTWGDERYFDRLNGSVGFNQISNIDLWSTYYDIEYDENMNRPGVVIEVPVDVWNLDDYRPVFASNDPIPVTMKVSYGGGKDGVIGFELYPYKAPFHVDNMLRHIDAGNYDSTRFHRVINDFMIQGGDFESGNGMGGYAARFYGYCNGLEAMPDTCDQTAWTLPDEAGNGLLHTEGALSMAKTSSPNTGGSQFFIVDAGPTPTHLDGVHTVFGRVTSGLDVVNSISEVEVQYPNRPLDDVLIISFARGEPSDDPEPEPGEEAEKKSAPSLAIYAGIAATGLIIIASVAVMLALRKEDDSLE